MNTSFRRDWLKLYGQKRAEGYRPDQARSSAKFKARYSRGKKTWILPSMGDEETIEYPNGWKATIKLEQDTDMRPPWQEHDGHGVVLDWGSHDEYRENWELCSDRRSYRYYDFKASLEIALRDGWGTPPYHLRAKLERAVWAVRADYEYLRRWCNDEWYWVGLIVTLEDENGKEIAEESVWGFDSDSEDYLASEARDWLSRMLLDERKKRREAARQERISRRFADALACGV